MGTECVVLDMHQSPAAQNHESLHIWCRKESGSAQGYMWLCSHLHIEANHYSSIGKDSNILILEHIPTPTDMTVITCHCPLHV